MEYKKRLSETGKQFKIYSDNIEDSAMRQFVDAMEQECVVRGALMPDAHTGYTLPIGGVIATKDMIFPSFVGYDIGCGVCALKTEIKKNEIEPHRENIFNSIYRVIPTGFNKNERKEDWYYSNIPMTETLRKRMSDSGGLSQLCSLGGGNHFIEISYDEEDFVWIVVHSGSRGIGWKTADQYMRLASPDEKAREGFYGFKTNSKEGKNYIKDLNFCLEFALENRKRMIKRVYGEICHYLFGTKDIEFDIKDNEAGCVFVNRNHNHAELKDGLWIHRKGATHAEKDMYGVIPGNMRDGSYIVRGKGNKESLCSSSHGAGRVLGRNQAKRELSLDEFKNQLTGITAKVEKSTLDESPDAYKNIFDVMYSQKDLVDIVHYLKPIINIKA